MNTTRDFTCPWNNSYWMKSHDFYCGFNMPEAQKSVINGDTEVSQSLPPYAKRQNFLVDDYKCPTSWLRSTGKTMSYFVPVKEGYGMWLDFNKNFENTKNVAIVVSVKFSVQFYPFI